MRTIAVLNQKGGVGKTTIAVNLAAAAHLAGLRTLVLDLDRQGSAFDWYSARTAGSKLDGLVVARADRALDLRKFRELSRGYDVVICDGPPRLGDVTRAAAVAADVVLIPLRAGATDWWACAETAELIDSADAIRAELKQPPVRRVFVLNALPPRTRLIEQAHEALSEAGATVAPTRLGNRVGYAQTMFSGESVLSTDAGSASAAEITELYRYAMEAA